jgi:hypothetical protein
LGLDDRTVLAREWASFQSGDLPAARSHAEAARAGAKKTEDRELVAVLDALVEGRPAPALPRSGFAAIVARYGFRPAG